MLPPCSPASAPSPSLCFACPSPRGGERGDQASGNGADGANGVGYAEMLASAATRECREAVSAPNAGDPAQLQRICDCTHDKIIAAQPGPLEPEESRRAKMKDALNACVAEAGANAAG